MLKRRPSVPACGGFAQPGCGVTFSSNSRLLLTNVAEFGLMPDGSMDPKAMRGRPFKAKRIALDIRVWETATGKELQRLPGQVQFCRPAIFSPDDRTILYQRLVDGPGFKTEGVLWDVASGNETRVFRDAEGVEVRQFLPDGSAVVGGVGPYGSGTVRFWDAATGKALPGLPPMSANQNHAYYLAPDGRTLVLPLALPGNDGGELRVFQLSASLLKPETRGEMRSKTPAASAVNEQPSKSPAAQALALIEKEVQQMESDFSRQYAAALPQARDELALKRAAGLARLISKARTLASDHPQDPASGDALVLALRLSLGVPDGPLAAQNKETLALLRRQFLTAPFMDRLAPWLAQNIIPDAESLLQTVLETHPSREVRGRAGYWLANGLQQRAEAAELLRQVPDLLGHPEVKQKPNVVALLRATNPSQTAARVEAIFEQIRKDYADVPLYDFLPDKEKLGVAAESALFALRNLAVGKTAPNIEGADLDGKKFRLSDYRGKVVVLIFCGHWCGPCRQMNPDKQKLVTRLAGKPFALLEVNSDDDPDEWREIMKKEGFTWRCWADGGKEGPIAQHWNVTRWPTIFIIDDHGVIRFKDLRDEYLGKTVDKLMDAMKK